MFDLSLIELSFFALVALLVLDADDIPKLARTLRGWLNKLAEFKYEITNTLDNATIELNLKETLKVVEAEKKKVEEDLREITKNFPKTTSASDIIKLNRQHQQEEELKEDKLKEEGQENV